MLLTNSSSNTSTSPFRQAATAAGLGTNSSNITFTAARGSIPLPYSFLPTRASNCTLPVQPPANCHGNGTFDSARCTCNCFTGFVNDLSVSMHLLKLCDGSTPPYTMHSPAGKPSCQSGPHCTCATSSTVCLHAAAAGLTDVCGNA